MRGTRSIERGVALRMDTREMEAMTKQALKRASDRARRHAEEGSYLESVLATVAENRNIDRSPHTELLIATLLDWQSHRLEELEKQIRGLKGR